MVIVYMYHVYTSTQLSEKTAKSVPDQQLLVAWQRQWAWEVAKNQLWGFVSCPFKSVEMFHDVLMSVQVFSGWLEGFFVDICNNGHQLNITEYIVFAAPVGISVNFVAVHWPRFVNELHGLDKPSLGDGEGTISNISRSEAARSSWFSASWLQKNTIAQPLLTTFLPWLMQ